MSDPSTLNPQPSTLQILGVGLPRTGTQSLADALEILGYRTIHGHGQIAPPGIHDSAEFIVASYRPVDDFDAAIECEYWLWLMEAYRTARIILTLRNPLDWFQSIARHIDHIHTRRTERSWQEIEEADRLHERLFGSRWPLRTLYLHAFETHQLAVREVCRQMDREMLIFDVTQWPRWDPLCRFLGKPLPPDDVKFPWRNRAF